MRGSGEQVLSSRCRRRSRRRARGQGLVEFAFVAPVLLMLVFGVVDFGRCMSADVTVTNSAREGARLASVQITQHKYSDSPQFFGGLIACPGGSAASPGVPLATSAEGAAWRQMQNAALNLANITKLEVRFYQADPALGGSAADMFDCSMPSTGSWSTTATESGSLAGSYSPASGNWVQVEIDYTYHTVTPLISQLFQTVTVVQTATMVIE